MGDQIVNADSVAQCGAGISFRHPLQTLSAETLQSALRELLHSENGPNKYQVAVNDLSEQLADAGGVRAATNELLVAARGHQRLMGDQAEFSLQTSSRGWWPTLLGANAHAELSLV